MSTEIIYKNSSGDQLTLQQAQLLNDYYDREQYINGELKRIDSYSKNRILGGTYYLSIDEDLQSVLSDVQGVWSNGYFYIDVQTIGNYTVRNWEVYGGIVKLSKGQTVYDNKGREIAEQTLDINTLAVIKTTKNYYLETFGSFNNNDDILNYGSIEFNYNHSGLSAGQISVAINLPGFDHREYYITDQNNELLNPVLAGVFS